MANAKGKTEHSGAKNGGGGMWGRRAEVKHASNRRRRAWDKTACRPDTVTATRNCHSAAYPPH